MGARNRSISREKRIVANIATSFEEADQWDLEFWQTQTPEDRLAALMSIRDDIAKIRRDSARQVKPKVKGEIRDE